MVFPKKILPLQQCGTVTHHLDQGSQLPILLRIFCESATLALVSSSFPFERCMLSRCLCRLSKIPLPTSWTAPRTESQGGPEGGVNTQKPDNVSPAKCLVASRKEPIIKLSPKDPYQLYPPDQLHMITTRKPFYRLHHQTRCASHKYLPPPQIFFFETPVCKSRGNLSERAHTSVSSSC